MASRAPGPWESALARDHWSGVQEAGMNVKLFDKVLFFGAVACFVAGGVVAMTDRAFFVLSPEGWWRGGIGLLALAAVCLLMQVRDALEAKKT
jgi:hypothetical protein